VRLGYFVNEYPKVSHSFIRREIAALEASGHEVHRWSLRGWNSALADPADLAERDKTVFLLQHGVAALLLATGMAALWWPIRWLKALRLSFALAHRSDRSAIRHLVSLLEASRLALDLRARDIAHLHAHFGTNAAEVALLAAELAGISFSFTVHGPDEFDRPLSLKLGLKIDRAAFVVAITSFCASQLYRFCPPQQWRKIHIVRCGLPPRYFEAPIAPLPDAPRFLNIGRLAPEKGHLILVEAVAELKRRGIAVTVMVLGDGDMRPAIEARIAELGVQHAITLFGWADDAQVRAQIDAARALVLPSFAEGLPIVVMEALAAGRPVLASAVAAMGDLVVSGQTGWLFPPADVAALADAMAACAETPANICAAMGERGRALVAERHDVTRESARLAILFASAAGRAVR